jgi:hypothetical protein
MHACKVMMAFIIAGMMAAVLMGCAHKQVIRNQCDGVSNRDNVFVCGKSEVLTKCVLVLDKGVFVCEE